MADGNPSRFFRYWARFAILAQRHIGEEAFRHIHMGVGIAPLRPGLDFHGNGATVSTINEKPVLHGLLVYESLFLPHSQNEVNKKFYELVDFSCLNYYYLVN